MEEVTQSVFIEVSLVLLCKFQMYSKVSQILKVAPCAI